MTVRELAAYLGVGYSTARALVLNEPGVLWIKGRGTGQRKHPRIPVEVAERIKRRMLAAA